MLKNSLFRAVLLLAVFLAEIMGAWAQFPKKINACNKWDNISYIVYYQDTSRTKTIDLSIAEIKGGICIGLYNYHITEPYFLGNLFYLIPEGNILLADSYVPIQYPLSQKDTLYHNSGTFALPSMYDTGDTLTQKIRVTNRGKATLRINNKKHKCIFFVQEVLSSKTNEIILMQSLYLDAKTFMPIEEIIYTFDAKTNQKTMIKRWQLTKKTAFKYSKKE
jgi:hypothetical protein